jgi:large subunit ribosomal protein L13
MAETINSLEDLGTSAAAPAVNTAPVHTQKLDQHRFYWHTGYPGGIKDRTARQLLEGRFPERVLENAVRRMMPGGPLTRAQLKNLRIYTGTEHPHEAQNPTKLDVAAMNSKNVKAQ